MLNALTIDIEDYFQVHAFSSVIKYEDWDKFESRIEQNTDRILDILKGLPPTSSLSPRTSQHATFFILGWIAERYPDLIRRIQKEGHEIACHGYAHQLIYRQTKEEFRQDIRKAKSILEDITGNEVIGYRAPSYSITDKSQWAFEILAEEGFKYDSSIFPIRHDFYGMPNAPRFPFVISLNGSGNCEFSVLNDELNTFQNSKLTTQNSINQSSVFQTNSTFTTHNSKLNVNNSLTYSLINSVAASTLKRSAPPTSNSFLEFPISTVKLLGQNLPISGGGYFRLFPYSLIKKGLKSINEKEGKPFIFYVHPWEIDPNQPRIKNSRMRSKLRHYINLDKTESKFRKILKDFQFATVHDLMIKSSTA